VPYQFVSIPGLSKQDLESKLSKNDESMHDSVQIFGKIYPAEQFDATMSAHIRYLLLTLQAIVRI
jgi:hypothetical protein